MSKIPEHEDTSRAEVQVTLRLVDVPGEPRFSPATFQHPRLKVAQPVLQMLQAEHFFGSKAHILSLRRLVHRL